MPLKPPREAHPLGIETLSDKAARDPESAFVLNELANQLAQHGRLLDAEDKYHQALTVDPHFAIAWNNLGVVLMSGGKLTRAKWAYGHAIDDKPDYALAYYNLGVAFDMQGNFDRAVENYRKAFELDPTLLDVKHNPQIVSNRHVAAAMLKSYIDRGGSPLLSIQSAYPSPAPKKPAPKSR